MWIPEGEYKHLTNWYTKKDVRNAVSTYGPTRAKQAQREAERRRRR